ncbi:hypothetical protein [Streptomyces sp. NPDC085479]|uniref:hypothetical protein n=1 Tax=Streptomyces sp. NPDC085479 TaxID=3365726 RepID=UPI0037D26C98
MTELHEHDSRGSTEGVIHVALLLRQEVLLSGVRAMLQSLPAVQLTQHRRDLPQGSYISHDNDVIITTPSNAEALDALLRAEGSVRPRVLLLMDGPRADSPRWDPYRLTA